ncbi:hypothetical protein C173_21046, partial [Paenibacillus sp. FSL R7-277]|uniref:hypothetical protein n=1 Tax=Paenibacillus sp. FSL R7-277 TaxID=1227352 RepID=UPI0003E1D576
NSIHCGSTQAHGPNVCEKQHTLWRRAGVWAKCIRKTAYIVVARRRMGQMYVENSIHCGGAQAYLAKCMLKTAYIVAARRRMGQMYVENSIYCGGTLVSPFM